MSHGQHTNNEQHGNNQQTHQEDHEPVAIQRTDTTQAMTDSPTRQFSGNSTFSIPGLSERANDFVQAGEWYQGPIQLSSSPPTETATDRSQMQQQQQTQGSEHSFPNSHTLYTSAQNNQHVMQNPGMMVPDGEPRSPITAAAAVNGGAYAAQQNRGRPIIHQRGRNGNQRGRTGDDTSGRSQPNGVHHHRQSRR